MNAPDTRSEPSLSVAVTQLMKGVVYRDTHAAAWQHLAALQPQVRDYVAVLGLVVVVHESEGYAYLKSRPEDPDLPPVPRLVPRRSLSFCASRSRRSAFPPRCAESWPRPTPVVRIPGSC